ncbi:DUF6241 domain-containing protein [Clostridium gasigenes]|uniref:Uncharacterized protein n=1 Tax=Clostridium gasigenes TaxID=94869 RepID=A0A1H0MSD9_9CLOT|nr:DUF6241 domain-containing protein [Clostridium gasigenes]SDO83050.1 hypothetical protein SAMN04488529_101550 [Clostridium gasigenes]
MDEEKGEYEESAQAVQNKRKLVKVVVIVNSVLLIAVIGFFAYNLFNKNFGSVNEAAKETLSEIKDIESKEEQKQIVKDYDFVHQMSNNLIVSSDGVKWGEQAVTLENIDLGIEMLKNDSYIVSELNRWKKGEFKNSVEVHNYCWRILEGNVGKAKGLYQEGIDVALKAIKKE